MEEWRDIKGYEGKYQVSSHGRVKSLNYHREGKEKILKPEVLKKGYLRVDLHNGAKRNKIQVHRLVAEAFIDNPNNYPQVNHKDENKQNNHVENLEWCTNKYNANYGTKLEKISKGKNWRASKVECIETGEIFDSLIEAEEKYNIKYQSISACCRGITYTAGGYTWKYIE